MKLIDYQCPVCGEVRDDSDIEEFVWCTSEQCDCNDVQMQPREVKKENRSEMNNENSKEVEETLNREYKVEIIEMVDPDDGDMDFYAFHPAFGHAACSAIGDTKEEALETLDLVRKDVLYFMIDTGKNVPESDL